LCRHGGHDLLLGLAAVSAFAQTIVVGGKNFTEQQSRRPKAHRSYPLHFTPPEFRL
jgi:hypothetical protein